MEIPITQAIEKFAQSRQGGIYRQEDIDDLCRYARADEIIPVAPPLPVWHSDAKTTLRKKVEAEVDDGEKKKKKKKKKVDFSD